MSIFLPPLWCGLLTNCGSACNFPANARPNAFPSIYFSVFFNRLSRRISSNPDHFEITYRGGVPDGLFAVHFADGKSWAEANCRLIDRRALRRGYRLSPFLSELNQCSPKHPGTWLARARKDAGSFPFRSVDCLAGSKPWCHRLSSMSARITARLHRFRRVIAP